MINISTVDIQKYIVSILKTNGIDKVFEFNIPRKISTGTKVFAFTRMSNIRTRGQFQFEAFGECFVYINIYVKALSDMELDSKTFKEYETKMRNLMVSNNVSTDEHYTISESVVGSTFVDEQRGYHVLQTTLKITIK